MANYTKEQLELIKEFVAEQERLRQVTKDNLSILQKGTPEYAAQSQQLQDINEELTKGRDKLTEIQRQRRLNNAELKEEIQKTMKIIIARESSGCVRSFVINEAWRRGSCTRKPKPSVRGAHSFTARPGVDT